MLALASVGSASLSWTFVAVLSPSLLTVIVKPTSLPATTVWASGVLVTLMCGFGVTIVIVLQSASLEPDAQLDFVTTTTFGRLVWPAAQPVSLSFTKYLNVASPFAAMVWLGQ